MVEAEWVLVWFTGVLVLVTAALAWATVGLVEATRHLRESAERDAERQRPKVVIKGTQLQALELSDTLPTKIPITISNVGHNDTTLADLKLVIHDRNGPNDFKIRMWGDNNGRFPLPLSLPAGAHLLVEVEPMEVHSTRTGNANVSLLGSVSAGSIEPCVLKTRLNP